MPKNKSNSRFISGFESEYLDPQPDENLEVGDKDFSWPLVKCHDTSSSQKDHEKESDATKQ